MPWAATREAYPYVDRFVRRYIPDKVRHQKFCGKVYLGHQSAIIFTLQTRQVPT